MSSSSRRAPPRQIPPPPQSLAAAGHARFIPREELIGYTNWSPGALGPAAQAPSTRPLQAPLVPPSPSQSKASDAGLGSAAGMTTADRPWRPEAAPDSVQPEAPDWEALQKAARQAGYHDGYRDGLAALENFKRSFAQQMASQIGALVSAAEQEFQSLEADMAQALVQAATGLARQIVRSELATRPELITHVARQAVAAVSQSIRHIELRVHPDDLALVQAGLGDEGKARGVCCVADESIARGGCSVSTELGSVDARIEHQWALALGRTGQDISQWPLLEPDQF